MLFPDPIRFFRLVGLIFGLTFVFLMPPFQAPDEFNHFFRAYQVSEGQWTGVRTPDQRLGGWLPQSLSQVAGPFRSLPFDFSARTSGPTILASLREPLRARDTAFTDFANTAIYAPTAYVPQAPVIGMLRRLDCPPLIMLYLARLACLLVWLALTELALRLLPFGRWLVAALVLLPSSLVLHASINADGITNAACLLLPALLLRRGLGGWKETERWETAGILLLSAFVALNKIVYAPLALLLLLRPNRPNIKLLIYVISINFFLILGWNSVTRQLFIPFDDYHPVYRMTQQLNEGVDPGGQLAYVLAHPWAFGRTAVVSLVETLPSATVHFVGKFGWEKNYLPFPLVGALVLLLGLLTAVEPVRLERKQRVLMLASAGLMTLAFVLVMYTLWNPVGAPFVHNLGGKYFIPIVPVALLAVCSGRLERWKEWIWKAFQVMIILSLLVMAARIVMRYY